MSPSNPAQEAFEQWRRSVEDGMQAWLRAVTPPGASQPAPPPPSGFLDFAQFWRPFLGQALEIWQQAAAKGQLTPEFAQTWKTTVDQSIEAWSKALAQAMASEGFAAALGRHLDQMLAAQAPWKKGYEQYTETALKGLGLPSRSQVVGVASQVVGLEERLEAIEDRLDELARLLRTPRRPAKGGKEKR